MRILHTECSRGWGGQELRILAEACGMAARGHEVWLAAPPASRIASAAAARGVRLIPVEFHRPWGLHDVLVLHRAIRRLGLDVLNTHSSWDAWMAGLAARLTPTGVRVVRTRHLSTPIARSRVSRLLYTRLADHIVTTGEAIRERMIQRNGFAAAQITSIVTGVDPARLCPSVPSAKTRADLGIPPDVPVVGTLSTLRSWKGHLDLLEALALLRVTRDVRGLIVGDGPYADVIRSRIRDLRLNAVVGMPGHREEVADLLLSMDVFAFPSYANEGVPQAVLQAMVLARPVVASNVGGIPEVVRDGQTGILVPPRDGAALAQAVARVLDDPAGAAGRAAAAADLVKREYSVEAMLSKMERVYRGDQ